MTPAPLFLRLWFLFPHLFRHGDEGKRQKEADCAFDSTCIISNSVEVCVTFYLRSLVIKYIVRICRDYLEG